MIEPAGNGLTFFIEIRRSVLEFIVLVPVAVTSKNESGIVAAVVAVRDTPEAWSVRYPPELKV